MDHFNDALETVSKAKSIANIVKCLRTLFKAMADESGPEALSLQEKADESDKKIVALEKTVSDLVEQKAEMEKIIENNADEIKDIKVSLATLEKKLDTVPPQNTISNLQDSLDSTDQYARRGALTISGKCLPVFSTTENAKEIVADQLRRHTQYVLNTNEISIAHRLGPKPTNGNDQRSIRFRLCRRDVAHEIMAACKQMEPPSTLHLPR